MPPVAPLRTRFAPSPTGDLHLGGLLCAFVSFALARASGGVFVVRVEDLDPPRVVPGAAARILEDLAGLGLAWDEPDGAERGPCAPYAQSRRGGLYAAATAALGERVYPCDCSRADLSAASAPHAGEELVYRGTCRELPRDRPMKRPPALRVRVPEHGAETFHDLGVGEVTQRLGEAVGDFVLQRGDGVFAYQLACAFDDHAMGIDVVVRGHDLLASTARQIWLGRLLGAARAPRYFHVPLVVTASGERLAKRTRGATVRALLARGASPEQLFGFLAQAAGFQASAAPVTRDQAIAAARAWLERAPEGTTRAPATATLPDALGAG